MSDQTVKACDNCKYRDNPAGDFPCMFCVDENRWEADVAFIDKTGEGKAILGFKDKLEDAIKQPFDLDKLINDHWKYVEDTLVIHGVYGVDMHRAEHHYKTAAKHFWKHCCEHYGIKEE